MKFRIVRVVLRPILPLALLIGGAGTAAFFASPDPVPFPGDLAQQLRGDGPVPYPTPSLLMAHVAGAFGK